jgi:hypothetical protein
MLNIIAEVLRQKLVDIPWAERTAGLTLAAKRAMFSTTPGLFSTQTGVQTYPVAAEVNQEECWENGVFKLLEPDATKASIMFFVDNGGARQLSVDGPKGRFLRYSFNLRLLVWVNMSRLGTDLQGDRNVVSGRLAPYVIAAISGKHDIAGVYNGGPEETAISGIEVREMSELQKDPVMFAPFDFRDRTELFFWPYDYFGFTVSGEFMLNKNCLEDISEGWEPTVSCLSPAWDKNWFNREAILYFASLPAFTSNEDALAGIAPDGSPTDSLVVGDLYWAALGHNSAAEGTLMRVL